MKKTHRRQFVKFALVGVFANAILQSFSSYAKAAKLLLIDMSAKKRKDETNQGCVKSAKGLGYVEDLAKALKSKETKKKVIGTWKVEDQTCENCQLFDYKKDGQDTCMVLPKSLVHKKGSCNSWVP